MKLANSRVFVLLVFLVFSGALMTFLLWRNNIIRQKGIVNETSYTNLGFNSQWPLTNIDNNPNSFLVRLVLENEVYFGSIEYGEHIIGAWNYGLFTDINGNISRVAIPRVWYNPSQQALFYPASTGLTNSPTLQSEKAFSAIIQAIDEIFVSHERLVGAYIAPDDNSLSGLSDFYKPVQNWTLPLSFIETGSIKDLPNAPKIGTFLPITQLAFDIAK